MTIDARDAAAQTRWEHWAGRYERSGRRRARYARVATALIFAAISLLRRAVGGVIRIFPRRCMQRDSCLKTAN